MSLLLARTIQFISKISQLCPPGGPRQPMLLTTLPQGLSHHHHVHQLSHLFRDFCFPISDDSLRSSQHGPLMTQATYVSPVPQTLQGCHLMQSEGSRQRGPGHWSDPPPIIMLPLWLWDSAGLCTRKAPMTPGPWLFLPLWNALLGDPRDARTAVLPVFAQVSAAH